MQKYRSLGHKEQKYKIAGSIITSKIWEWQDFRHFPNSSGLAWKLSQRKGRTWAAVRYMHTKRISTFPWRCDKSGDHSLSKWTFILADEKVKIISTIACTVSKWKQVRWYPRIWKWRTGGNSKRKNCSIRSLGPKFEDASQRSGVGSSEF